MADYELKEGKFSMFKQTEKSKENSPDFTGRGMFDGNEVRLSGWVQKSKDGKTYISGTIQHKTGSSAPATPADVDDFLGEPDPLSEGAPMPPDTPKRTEAQTAEASQDLPF